jgi:hypothetical protein
MVVEQHRAVTHMCCPETLMVSLVKPSQPKRLFEILPTHPSCACQGEGLASFWLLNTTTQVTKRIKKDENGERIFFSFLPEHFQDLI